MDKLAGSWPKMRSAESCGRVSASGLIYRLVELWNRRKKSTSACAAKILHVFFIFSTILMCVYLGQGQQEKKPTCCK
jgi:hypothetical protein